jgi:alkylation response protein AidB-like acyl-CoA dehydrogenase
MAPSARTETRARTSADELADVARASASAADATGQIAPEVIEALRSAGFPRHFVPSRWGGNEGSFASVTRSVLSVGEACPSTAWLASLAASSGRFAAHLPADGQAEIWRDGPDVLMATALVPSGRAVPEGDGWRLAGRWGYVSGIEFADWALVCAPAGDDPAGLRFFALPRGHYEVQRTWDSIGMRATGSHTMVADGLVPARRSFLRSELISGKNATSAAACHNVPFRAIGGPTFVAPVAGAVTGALHAAARMLAAKHRAPSTDLALVRSSARVDTVRALVEQTALALDSGDVTPAMAAVSQRNAAFAGEQAAEAASDLIRAAGTGGLSQAEPVQRYWRDVMSMTSHVSLRFETSAVTTYLPLLLTAAQ